MDKDSVYFDGIEWNIFVTRNMSFWHQCLSSYGIFHHMVDFGIPVHPDQLGVILDGTKTTIFMHEPDFSNDAKEILNAVKTKGGIGQIKEKYFLFSKELLESLAVCDSNLTLENWNNFTKNYSRFCPALQITAVLGRYGLSQLENRLTEIGYEKSEIPRIISIITYPRGHTPLFESQIDLLKIGSKIQTKKISDKERDDDLKNWLDKYQHIPVNFCDESWKIEDAFTQLENLLKKDCGKELEVLNTGYNKKSTEAIELIRKINDEEVSTLAGVLAETTLLNEFRKGIFSKVSFGYRDIFSKIANMAGSNNWRDCFYLTAEEMGAIISGNKVNIKDILVSRKIIGEKVMKPDGLIKILDKKDIGALVSYLKTFHQKEGLIKDDEKDLKEFKGFSASGGVIKGVVKIILSSKDFHKLLSGEVLVTTMTSVDFVPVMERAVAFVTNEGGITSHASIVAREMGKPCIIGTKIATKVLKDGDEVEVDANMGVVKILRRSQNDLL